MVLLVWPQENRFTPESPGNKARRLKGASLQDLQGMQPVVLHLRALQDGVDRDAVNAAMNDNDPKSALIRLIMQEAELSRAHQRNVGVQQSEVQRLPAAPTKSAGVSKAMESRERVRCEKQCAKYRGTWHSW